MGRKERAARAEAPLQLNGGIRSYSIVRHRKPLLVPQRRIFFSVGPHDRLYDPLRFWVIPDGFHNEPAIASTCMEMYLFYIAGFRSHRIKKMF